MRDRLDAFLDRYGYDGTHARGWAHVPAGIELVLLGLEKRRRAALAGGSPTPKAARPLEVDLFLLRAERWLRWLREDVVRQERVAEALDVVPGVGPRPWVWCHEEQHLSLPSPVAYAHDWRPDEFPDLYGFGDRWVEGEVLVIPVDELPAEVEVVGEAVRVSSPAPPDAKALPDGIDDAEVVGEPVERRLAEGRVRVRLNSPPKMIGTWDPSSGFRPVDGSW